MSHTDGIEGMCTLLLCSTFHFLHIWHTCLPNASRNLTGTQDTDFYAIFYSKFLSRLLCTCQNSLFVHVTVLHTASFVILWFSSTLLCFHSSQFLSPFLEVLLWLQGIVLTWFRLCWIVSNGDFLILIAVVIRICHQALIGWYFMAASHWHSWWSSSFHALWVTQHDWAFWLLLSMYQQLSVQVLYSILPKFWAGYYILIYIHFEELMKSVVIHSGLSQQFMMKVMVWRWRSLSQGYKLQLHLLSCYFPIVVAEVSLQFLSYLWLKPTRWTALSLVVFVFGFAGTHTVISFKELLRGFFLQISFI